MGKSYTYHVVGYAARADDPTDLHYLFPAMNRGEISQQRNRAKRQGLRMMFWRAQTETGERLLGGDYAPDSQVQGTKVVSCPICKGRGCVICEHSGVCPPNHWERWQPWQLEAFRQAALGYQKEVNMCLAERLDGARLVRWDPISNLILVWFGGHGVHAFTVGGKEVAYWNTGDAAQINAAVEDIEASMEERIDQQDYPLYS